MPKIHILPIELANIISAGEVIERPASVVKELIDNAIDAGATQIDVQVNKSGIRSIVVSDNGCGMSAEDALLAFERFATSKLHSKQDLQNLLTHGFRGEALSAIASVSKVTLRTSERVDGKYTEGVELRIEPNKPVLSSPSVTQGTTIEVKDLFFNTPARLKFLKSPITENSHIINTVTASAISYPNVSFTLRLDGGEVLKLPAVKTLKERLIDIFGVELIAGLLQVSSENGDYALEGFISKPEALHKSKKMQYCYVNNRYVLDPLMSFAIAQGYAEALPKDLYPAVFLKLTLPPNKVDFNVHPAKKEVRFVEKSAVYSFITTAVKDVVFAHRFRLSKQGMQEPQSPQNTDVATGTSSFSYSPTYSPEISISDDIATFSTYDISCMHITGSIVAITNGDGLILMDYHSAHERVNYERLLAEAGTVSQPFLFPIQVRLDEARYKALIENSEELHKLGISINDFGLKTVIVRSAPDFVSFEDIPKLMPALADDIIEGLSVNSKFDELRKKLATTIACHHSMRAGSQATPAEIIALFHKLQKTSEPDVCPHGRPTILRWSRQDLFKMFKRF